METGGRELTEPTTETPAEGVRGFLLYDPNISMHLFRVYTPPDKKTYTDYALRVESLKVEILDPYFSLFTGPTGNYVGYAGEPLGSADPQ